MKFTQQELMAAHIAARHSAELDAAQTASESSVVEPVDPYRKPLPFVDTEHPFGHNDNNRRVALRIARDQAEAQGESLKKPLTPAQAAARDLQAAEAFGKSEDEALSDEEMEAESDALIAAALNGSPVGNLSPAQKAAQTRAANAAAKAAAAVSGEDQPPVPADPPSWRNNA